MKKLLIFLVLGFTATQIQAAPQNKIPAAFQGKWVEAGESCEEYENGESVRWWGIDKHKISQYRFSCTLDKALIATPRQLQARWQCGEIDDDDTLIQSTPTETFTLSSDGKQLTAFGRNYRFCGKFQSRDEFVCQSNKINVAVSSYNNDYRYTAWSKSRLQPDLFLQNGNVRIDGTGQCLHSVYAFSRPGGWLYEVRERGCHTAEQGHIKGWVTVTRHGKTISEIACK